MSRDIEYSRLKKVNAQGSDDRLVSTYDIVMKKGIEYIEDDKYKRITTIIQSTLKASFKEGVVAQDILILEGEKPEIKVKGRWMVLEQTEEWDIDCFNYFLFNMSKLSTTKRNGIYKLGSEQIVRNEGKETSNLKYTGEPVNIRSREYNARYGSRVLDTEFFRDLMDQEGGSYDYSLNMGDNILRCHVYSAYGGIRGEKVGISIRVVPQRIPRLHELNLPNKLEDITNHSSGLFLVSGRTGDGKSTTVASIVNKFNRDQYGRRVITIIEDPVEFIHKSVNAKIIQRRLGGNVPSYARATSDALRESTDIVVLGELRGKDEIINALRLAETGKLVIATIHANSVADTVDRFVGEFENEKEHYRSRLMENLLGILHQNLMIYEGEQFPLSSLLMLEDDDSRATLRGDNFSRASITKLLEEGNEPWAVSKLDWFNEIKGEAETLRDKIDGGEITRDMVSADAVKKLTILKGDAKKALAIKG